MEAKDMRQNQTQDRKQEIYQAARQVFLKKGYKNTTIKDITGKVSLSVGSFYLYFESKGEVYALLAIEFLEYLKNEIVKVAALGEPEEKLLNIRKLFFKIYDSDKRILINLINTRSSDALEGVPSDIAEQIKSLSGDCLKVLVETIEEGMDQQVFRKENPVVLADIIWGTFSGLILLAESKRMLNNRNDFVKTTIKTALDTIHRGINPVIG